MQLGFLTVPFGDWSLERVASWAVANGFSALEIACWPAGSGDARRYAGVTHIDVDALTDESAAATMEMLAEHGIDGLRRSATTRTTSTRTPSTARPSTTTRAR